MIAAADVLGQRRQRRRFASAALGVSLQRLEWADTMRHGSSAFSCLFRCANTRADQSERASRSAVLGRRGIASLERFCQLVEIALAYTAVIEFDSK